MENQINLKELINETIEEVLEKMGFVCDIEFQKNSDNDNLIFNIKTEESSFLIGQYGINLQSLQHIIRILVRQKTQDKINFLLDVNSYRQEKNNSIEKLARDAAFQCEQRKKDIVLRPMSDYERRIVHLVFANDKQFVTESIGEGEERKVVVKLR